MQDAWDELEQLCTEISSADTDREERHARIESELAGFRAALDLVERQLDELQPEAALDAVRRRLFGGAGIIQRTTFDFGLERLIMLAWPPAADPRPDRAAARGEYRVEVWLGLGDRGRARVRVVGEKRLEAVLPVAPEKFRSVLLSAVRAPAFTPAPDGESAQSEADSAEPAPAAEGTPPPAPESSAGGGVAAAEEARSPAAETGEQAAPPDSDEPIPMGPPTASEGT